MPGPLVWPVVLLAVGAGLMLAGEGLARIDGFRLYGVVSGMGGIVGVIGAGWLAGALLRLRLTRSARRPGS